MHDNSASCLNIIYLLTLFVHSFTDLWVAATSRTAKAQEAAKEETAVQTVIVEDGEEAFGNDKHVIYWTHSLENNNDKTFTDTAEEASVAAVADELCPDIEFDAATPSEEFKSICTTDFSPIKYKLEIL